MVPDGQCGCRYSVQVMHSQLSIAEKSYCSSQWQIFRDYSNKKHLEVTAVIFHHINKVKF